MHTCIRALQLTVLQCDNSRSVGRSISHRCASGNGEFIVGKGPQGAHCGAGGEHNGGLHSETCFKVSGCEVVGQDGPVPVLLRREVPGDKDLIRGESYGCDVVRRTRRSCG